MRCCKSGGIEIRNGGRSVRDDFVYNGKRMKIRIDTGGIV